MPQYRDVRIKNAPRVCSWTLAIPAERYCEGIVSYQARKWPHANPERISSHTTTPSSRLQVERAPTSITFRGCAAARGPGVFTDARRGLQPGAFPPWPQAAPAAPRYAGFGLAASSSTRLIGGALLAVTAPPSGRPALRSGNSAPDRV